MFLISTYGSCTFKLYLGDMLTGLPACRELPHSMRLPKGFGDGGGYHPEGDEGKGTPGSGVNQRWVSFV